MGSHNLRFPFPYPLPGILATTLPKAKKPHPLQTAYLCLIKDDKSSWFSPRAAVALYMRYYDATSLLEGFGLPQGGLGGPQDITKHRCSEQYYATSFRSLGSVFWGDWNFTVNWLTALSRSSNL